MQWIVDHKPKLYLVIISLDIGVQSILFGAVLS